MLLYLIIPIGLTIINEIILEIKEIEKSIDEKVEEFKSKIETLNKKLKEKDTIIEDYKSQLNNLSKNYNMLKKRVENNKPKINNIQKKNNVPKIPKNPIGSYILLENEINLIKDWLNNNQIYGNIKYENISFELLYRASRDGDSASKFHELCDGKGPTIIFVKNEDDMRYGGYTSIPWNDFNEYESDPFSFLFSLTNKEKFVLNNENDKNAVYHSKTCGPAFGENQNDLFIPDNCFKCKKFKCYSNSFVYDNNKMYNGKISFLIKDYEVYLVKFK